LQDIRNVIGRRWPAVRLLLCPVNVQGFEAAQEIAAAIDRLDRSGHVDEIIVARGGGSREDLWVFNAEIIARAAYRCKTPLISAIGHEIDFTILDFVADRRAPTPSAAAELAVPDRAQLEKDLFNLQQNIHKNMQNRCEVCYNNLATCTTRLAEDVARQKLSDGAAQTARAAAELRRAMQATMQHKEQQLAHAAALADSLNPYHVLARGYTMLTSPDGAVRTVPQLRPGETVVLNGAASRAQCIVTAVEKEL
jgi:exodeoxyribonuclease VII large subunit